MTFKVKDGVQVGSTLVLDSNGYLTTRLATARTIALSGDVSGSAAFDGSANISITATVADDSHSHSNYLTGESDTLASVTARGATTSTQSAFNGGLTSSGYTNLGGQLYVSGTNTNTLNSGYSYAADGYDIWINYRGHNDGQSYFRNFNVGDGKGNNILWADGPNKRLSINNAQSASYTLHVNGIGYSSSDFRAPIFYDSNDTGYYVDPNGTSKLNVVTDANNNQFISGRHSGSDFPNGTLVRTNIVATGWAGDSFVLECSGKSYQSGEPPFSFMAQGYLYADTIINYSGMSNGAGLSYIKFFQLDGYLCAWWPRFSYWNSFEVRVRDAGGSSTNRVTSITDSALPSGTKMVQVDLKQSVMWNYNSGNTGALYGSILYDSNDTGYYIDPNSTGTSLRLAGYGYFGLGIDSDGVIINHDQIWTPSGNFHIQYSGGGNIDMCNGGGYAWSRTSFRSPIFYDSNDTTYYVDPAGNGTRAAYLNGNLWINPKSESYGEGIAFLMPSQGTWGGIRWTRSTSNFTGAWAFGYFGNESNDDIGFHNGTNGWRLDHSFNMTSIGSVRSPIFYDSNDTGYYVDPNSTSNSALRMRGGALFGPNPTWGAYLYVGTDGRVGSEATVAVTNGNLHIDSKNGYGLYFNWYSTNNIYTNANMGIGSDSASYRLHVHGTGYATSDFRAPIFYDSDDTGWYTNPASTSRMRNIDVCSIAYTANYYDAAIEVREYNMEGAGDDTWQRAPRIGFHWGGRVASSIAMSSNGWINIMNNPGTGFESLRCSEFYATGNVTAYYSDERLKTKVGSIEYALEKVKSIETFLYINNDIAIENGFTGTEIQVGVSAQSVEKVLPEVVKHAPFDMQSIDGAIVSKTGEWYKTVQYDRLVPLLIEAIKEQQDIIESQETRIARLEALVQQLIGD